MVEIIKDFMARENFSQNRFAALLNINAAYLSGYLKKGESYEYAYKVIAPAKNFIDNYIKKVDASQDELPYLKTQDAISCETMINWAVKSRDMAIIVGNAGTGKSRVIKEYAKIRPDVVLIEATIGTSAKSLLKLLAGELNIEPKGGIDELIRKCATSLKATSKTIIIDEAEHLPFRALESIRRVYDFSRCTLVLVGTMRLKLNLTNKNSHYELEQLSSRGGGKWILKGLSYYENGKQNTDDLQSLCELFELRDTKCINLIASLTKGNFRKSEKLLRRAKMLSEYAQKDGVIDEEMIKEATRMLLLD